MSIRQLVIIVGVTAVFATACGARPSSTGAIIPTTTTAVPATADAIRSDATSTTVPQPEEPDPVVPTTTIPAPAPTQPARTVDTIPPADLPGEPVGWPPYAGSPLIVVGVEAGDVLFVRAGPGASYPEITSLAPQAQGIVAVGANRRLSDGGHWGLVSSDGIVGWANLRYLSQPGRQGDVTAEIGPVPVARSMDDLARTVAAQRMAIDSEGRPEIVIAARGEVGGRQEVVLDVLGFADDSVAGERLRLTASNDAGGFRLVSVVATTLCYRGVSNGLCT